MRVRPYWNHTEAKARRTFALCVAAAFAMWTMWCGLMVSVGEPFSSPIVRAIARVAGVLVPALIYLRRNGPRKDKMGLRHRWRFGVLVAVFVSAAHIALVACNYTLDWSSAPTDVDVWVNVILLSPLAEELLFRRVAIDHLSARHHASVAIVISSFLFAAFHWPQWLLLGEYDVFWVAGATMALMLYGVVLGIVYRLTRSLWASLLPNCISNFAGTIIT